LPHLDRTVLVRQRSGSYSTPDDRWGSASRAVFMNWNTLDAPASWRPALMIGRSGRRGMRRSRRAVAAKSAGLSRLPEDLEERLVAEVSMFGGYRVISKTGLTLHPHRRRHSPECGQILRAHGGENELVHAVGPYAAL